MPEEEKPNPNVLDGSDYPLSEELEKERQKTEIPVHGRRMGIRIAAFVVVLGVAIAFISLGIAGFFTGSTGIQEITVNSDKEQGLRYGKGYHLFYNITGSQFETNGKIRAIRGVYTEVMKDSYRLFDEYNDYDDLTSIHYLSTHPDTDVTVDSRLYSALREIYEDESSRPFLFQSPYREVWDTLMVGPNEGLSIYDPSVYKPNADYLDSYASILNGDDPFTLTFKDNNVVVFHRPSTYSAWAIAYEYNGPSLSLGLLKDAYRISMAGQKLLNEGLSEGVMMSEEGSSLSLGGLTSVAENVYAYEAAKGYVAGVLTFGGTTSVANLHLVPVGSTHDPYAYTLKSGENQLRRNLLIDPTSGYPYSGLTSLRLEGNTLEIAKVKVAALKMLASASDVDALAKGSPYSPIYAKAEEELTIHLPLSKKDKLILMTEKNTKVESY